MPLLVLLDTIQPGVLDLPKFVHSDASFEHCQVDAPGTCVCSSLPIENNPAVHPQDFAGIMEPSLATG